MMSMYSDYKVGALSEYEYRELCKKEDRKERICNEEWWDRWVESLDDESGEEE